jgi:hypothetical protein
MYFKISHFGDFTPQGRLFFEKLAVPQLVKRCAIIFGTKRFVTVLTRATGPYPERDESSPQPHTLLPSKI